MQQTWLYNESVPAMSLRESALDQGVLRILAFAPNEWAGPWMNRQNLLSRLSSQHEIIYTNGIWASWDRRRDEYQRAPLLSRFDRRDGVDVDQRGRLHLRVPRLAILDSFAIRIACNRWRQRFSRSRGPLVAYAFHPEFLPYVSKLGADFIVYHAYDLFRFMERDGRRIEAEENRLLEIADLVIATSEETARDMRTRRDRRVEVLGNGVDFARFVRTGATADPPELANIPRPRIGYVGAINQKLDIGLLARLAARRPTWQFVLVGEAANLQPGDEGILETLGKMPNAHLIGPVLQERAPPILQAIDVGIVSYRKLTWTLAGFPLKALEYLACGLPVVATDLPSLREFHHVMALVQSEQEWEAAIEAALAGHGVGEPASRIAAAKANSWDMRVRQLNALLESMASSRSRVEVSAPELSSSQ